MTFAPSHVDPDVAPLLFQSNGTRIRFIAKSGFVEWPHASHAVAAIVTQGEGDLRGEPSS
jgi:hypothetical protein